MQPIARLRRFGTSSQHVMAGCKPSVKEDGPALLEAEQASVLGQSHCIDHHLFHAFKLAMAFHADAPTWLKEYPELLLERGPSSLRPWELTHFMEYLTSYRGLGRSVRRFVAGWYAQQVSILGQDLAREEKRRWRHQDIIRMCHVKPDEGKLGWLLQYAVGKANFDSEFSVPALHARHLVEIGAVPREIMLELIMRYRVEKAVWPKDLQENEDYNVLVDNEDSITSRFKRHLAERALSPSTVAGWIEDSGYLSPYAPLRLSDYLRLMVLAGKQSRDLVRGMESKLDQLTDAILKHEGRHFRTPPKTKIRYGVCQLGLDDGLVCGLPNISKKAVATMLVTEVLRDGAFKVSLDAKRELASVLVVVADSLDDKLLGVLTAGAPIEIVVVGLGKGNTKRELPRNITEVHGYSIPIHRVLGSVTSFDRPYEQRKWTKRPVKKPASRPVRWEF